MRLSKIALKTRVSLVTYATWNPADKGANITLSNGNLTCSVASGGGTVRATQGLSSGKWYWEETITTDAGLGVANISAALSTFVGGDANGWSYYANGSKYNSAGGSAYGASFTTGDVIGVALDMVAGTITFYKNGVSQGVAFSGLSGTLYPATSTSGGVGSQVANFGATALAYSPPGGHNAGVYQ